ncbi:hypothetical protein [Williamsia sp. Leaf354]|uniref:hypothetical protein n=1 Tax=Williamsia sp. Leaf354 TaxID=1736349 RepID=UPI0012E3EDBE|nr:hypothetical protein [Williamsia sp. Leaf354]
MDSDWIDSAFNPTAAVLKTLEDFDAVQVIGGGAIIFPANLHVMDGVVENIVAVTVAAGARLSSVDYARRKYVAARNNLPAEKNVLSESFRAARRHISASIESMDGKAGGEPSVGVFASAVALQRLQTSLLAAHVLYSLGLNYEGDAVARQVLEQIAWSVSASKAESVDALKKISASGSVGELKSVVGYAGRMYGMLCKFTHPGYEQHLAAFEVGDDGLGRINVSWDRRQDSALTLVLLADLWVVAWELTQRDFINSFVAWVVRSKLELNEERQFLIYIRENFTADSDSRD